MRESKLIAGLCGLLLILPLAVNPWGVERFTLIKGVLLLAAAFALLVSWVATCGIRRPPHRRPLLAFLGIGILSLLSAVNAAAGVRRLSLVLAGAVVFVIVAGIGEAGTFRLAVSRTVSLAGGVVALYALLERVGVPALQDGRYVFVSTLGNPNYVAEYVAMAIPIAVGLLLSRRGAERLGLLALVAIMYAALLVSGSKGAAAAWIVGTGLASIFMRVAAGPGPWREQRRVLLVLAGLLLVESFLLGRHLVSVQVKPTASAGGLSPGVVVSEAERFSFTFRMAVARDTWAMIQDHPLLGVGAGNYPLAIQGYVRMPETVLPWKTLVDHAHNDYLELAAELGLPGLAAFLWLVAAAGADGIRHLRASPSWLGAGILGAMGTFLANSAVNFGFYNPAPMALFWVLLGLLPVGWAEPPEPAAFTQSGIRIPKAVIAALVGTGGALLLFSTLPVVGDRLTRKAFEAYEKRRPEEAGQLLERALAWDGNNAQARFTLVTLRYQQGCYAEGIATIRAGLERDPYSYLLTGALGGFLEAVGDATGARVAYERTLALYPHYSGATVGMGSLAEKSGDTAMAMRLYEKALQQNPRNVEGNKRLGRLLVGQGKPADGLPFLREATALAPTDPTVSLYLGQAYLALGDRLRGLMELDRARRLDPMNLEILQAWRAAMAGPAGTLPPGHPPLSPPGCTP